MQSYTNRNQKMNEDYGFFCEMEEMETSATPLNKYNKCELDVIEQKKIQEEELYYELKEHSHERPLSFFLLCVMQEPMRFAYICAFSCLTCGLIGSGYVSSMFYK